MDNRYFNYSTHFAERSWERRAFVKGWQRIYAADPRWVAPHRRQRQILLHPERDPYLSRTVVSLIRLEALPRRRQAIGMGGALWEESVAAGFLCAESTAKGRTGRLALFHCANDEETVDRLIGVAQEELWHHGCHRFIAPTGLSPHLQSGLLTNYFHVTPPLHTPYNPPYLPELLAGTLRPLQESALFHFDVTQGETVQQDVVQEDSAQRHTTDTATSSIELQPLSPALVHSDAFLALWQTAVPPVSPFSPPDPLEVAFLWKWLTVWPWAGWVATAEGKPVGFVLLQPDLAEQSRIAKGGQNLLWALWLHWRQRTKITKGRIVFGAVLPEWQRRGIGHALWRQMVEYARQQQWQTVTIGPLPANGEGAAFLRQQGAQMQQTYVLYANEV